MENTGIVRDKHSFIQGMEFAMRICRNQAQDGKETNDLPREAHAHNCVGVIRIVQVEIGAGRQPLPEFTPSEINEMERIR